MKLYLLLSILFLSLFTIGTSHITLTYSDLILFLVLPIIIFDLLKFNVRIDQFSKLYFAYIMILLFSSIINLTIFDGRFLNVFKTSLISFILYSWMYRLVFFEIIKNKQFYIGITIIFFAYILYTWPQLLAAWQSSITGFTNQQIFTNSLNLNTWGFILLLFLIIYLYSWRKGLYKFQSIVLISISLFFIIFSLSRSAYILSIFSLLWAFFSIRRINFKRYLFLIISLITLAYILKGLVLNNFLIPNAALEFLERKAITANEDFLNTRIYLINILPLSISYNEFTFIQFFIGDGISVQHSWLSHNLIVTGVIGFTVYILMFYSIIYKAIKNEGSITVINEKFILLLILITLFNDFVANLTMFLPLASYITYILLAYFMANYDIEKKSNEN